MRVNTRFSDGTLHLCTEAVGRRQQVPWRVCVRGLALFWSRLHPPPPTLFDTSIVEEHSMYMTTAAVREDNKLAIPLHPRWFVSLPQRWRVQPAGCNAPTVQRCSGMRWFAKFALWKVS